MLPKKYHAIVFIGLLVMLLLLGLHLLGIGYSTSPAVAKTAALSRNSSSQQTSSSSSNNLNVIQPVYRHPIVYDKLTGATNNQINDVLGAKLPAQLGDYPIDHYQQQQLQLQRQQQQQQQQQPFNPLSPQDDFLFNIHNQPASGFPIGHPLSRHMSPQPPHGLPPLHHLMTTQPPGMQQQMPPIGLQPLPPPPQSLLPPPPPPPSPTTTTSQRQDSPLNQPTDSLPSASSLNNNTSNQQQQQPIYYTPPIFAYNNFDQNRPTVEQAPLPNQPLVNPFNYQTAAGQRRGQQPLMIPEAPLSVDEYNARQAKHRQQAPLDQQQQQQDRYQFGNPQQATNNNNQNIVNNINSNQITNQNPNLLADPQQQQRHRQEMLDRQLLFSNAPFPVSPDGSNLTNYYPDPAIYRNQPNTALIRPPPPYVVNPQTVNNAPLRQNPPPTPPSNHRMVESGNKPLMKSAPLNRTTLGQLQQASEQHIESLPTCARIQQEQFILKNPEAINSSLLLTLPTLFCNEDPEYPTKEVMRALETYANDRSIEQLLPQFLLQMHLLQPINGLQQQLTLDSLQPSINLVNNNNKQELVSFDDQRSPQRASSQLSNLFPSANFEPLCKSNAFMAQPRRARNLMGRWKVVVNLPGHKYRGIAISQMVRIEECSQPNSECSAGSINVRSTGSKQSRCLQHYENQRLVAWSHQQGLHVDIFRVPIACSCHIRK